MLISIYNQNEPISVYQNFLYHTIFNSLQIAITKTCVNTTRRCDLTSVLDGLIFDTAYEELDTLFSIIYSWYYL